MGKTQTQALPIVCYVCVSLKLVVIVALVPLVVACGKTELVPIVDSDRTDGSWSGTAQTENGYQSQSAQNDSNGQTQSDLQTSASVTEATTKVKIFVHIAGAVSKPGVYELEYGARLVDAVKAAGGLATGAAADYVNLAKSLTDGSQVYIPNSTEVEAVRIALGDGAGHSQLMQALADRYGTDESSVTSGTGQNSNAAGASEQNATQQDPQAQLVDINSADASLLRTLPGIGAKRADDIINYRNQNGSFASIEDIKKVSGIGDGIFNSLKDLITVR